MRTVEILEKTKELLNGGSNWITGTMSRQKDSNKDNKEFCLVGAFRKVVNNDPFKDLDINDATRIAHALNFKIDMCKDDPEWPIILWNDHCGSFKLVQARLDRAIKRYKNKSKK